ncbi:MAG TPA: nucleotidyltransferase family protein, partial [Chloroflexi bacterium]|nr:nucleotidyltransferase family protein [Chloroflexota bacterium]
MAENFDPLRALLQLVQPGLSPDELYALAAQLNPEQWQALIAEAELQGVMPYLYTLLLDLNNSHGFQIPQKERLHQSYLATAARNMLALHDAEIILNTLQEAGISAAGLKGVYLLEQVYPSIGAR